MSGNRDADQTLLVGGNDTSGSDSSTLVVLPRLPHLIGLRGPAELIGMRFALGPGETTIGRRADCNLTVQAASISRVHATLRTEDGQWMLLHRSSTNSTALNGEPLQDRAALFDGDEIQLADSVAFRFDAPGLPRRPNGAAPATPAAFPRTDSLRAVMEERLRIEEHIEKRFVRDGTFLDIDVVDSYGLKSAETRPDRIVVSFERFRELVERCIVARGGQILNSNGDEIMAFFDDADDAVAAARDLLRSLADFNRDANRLARPFEVRLGAHTGRSAVDLETGVAYSPVLDLAGHLQKAAPPNALLVSQETYAALHRPCKALRRSGVGKSQAEAYELRFGD